MVESGQRDCVESAGDLGRAGKCLAVEVGEYFTEELVGEVVGNIHRCSFCDWCYVG